MIVQRLEWVVNLRSQYGVPTYDLEGTQPSYENIVVRVALLSPLNVDQKTECQGSTAVNGCWWHDDLFRSTT